MKKPLLIGLWIGFILLLVEGGSWVVTKLLRPVELPSFSWRSTGRLLRDYHPGYGTCQEPNSFYVHRKNCFNVTYAMNGLGFRDKVRTSKTDCSRVLVLGDSMLFGMGLSIEDRLSDRLEKLTGIEHLNFAISGTGTTQHWLVYKSVRDQFKHEAVLVGFLPCKMLEDDPNVGPRLYPGAYRPYLDQTGEPQMPAISLQTNDLPLFQRMLKNFSHTYNVAAFLYYGRRASSCPRPDAYHYTEAQKQRTIYLMRQIKALAGVRSLRLIIIPSREDVAEYARTGKSPLVAELERDLPDISVTDLMPVFAASKEHLYFDCDPHWNARANQIAASLLADKLDTNK